MPSGMFPVENGSVFIELKTGQKLVVSTRSDTFLGRRYVRYLDGRPAGTVLTSDLVDESLYRRDGRSDPPDGQEMW